MLDEVRDAAGRQCFVGETHTEHERGQGVPAGLGPEDWDAVDVGPLMRDLLIRYVRLTR